MRTLKERTFAHLFYSKCFQLFSNRWKLSTMANWPLFLSILIHFSRSFANSALCSRALLSNRTKTSRRRKKNQNIHLHASYNAQNVNGLQKRNKTKKNKSANNNNKKNRHIFDVKLCALAWLHSEASSSTQRKTISRSDNWPLKYLNQRASASSSFSRYSFVILFLVLCTVFCFNFIAVLNLIVCPYT